MPKICEVCGKREDHVEEEKYDLYGVCFDCMNDRDLDHMGIKRG
jgi:hypothetical protein